MKFSSIITVLKHHCNILCLFVLFIVTINSVGCSSNSSTEPQNAKNQVTTIDTSILHQFSKISITLRGTYDVTQQYPKDTSQYSGVIFKTGPQGNTIYWKGDSISRDSIRKDSQPNTGAGGYGPYDIDHNESIRTNGFSKGLLSLSYTFNIKETFLTYHNDLISNRNDAGVIIADSIPPTIITTDSIIFMLSGANLQKHIRTFQYGFTRYLDPFSTNLIRMYWEGPPEASLVVALYK